MLGASTICLTGGLFGGVLVGRTIGGSEAQDPKPAPSEAKPREDTSPELEWARELAMGPLTALLKAKYTFLGRIQQIATDDVVAWYGVSRLGHSFVEADPGERDAMLGRVLHGLGTRGQPPAYLRPLFDHVKRCIDSQPR